MFFSIIFHYFIFITFVVKFYPKYLLRHSSYRIYSTILKFQNRLNCNILFAQINNLIAIGIGVTIILEYHNVSIIQKGIFSMPIDYRHLNLMCLRISLLLNWIDIIILLEEDSIKRDKVNVLFWDFELVDSRDFMFF